MATTSFSMAGGVLDMGIVTGVKVSMLAGFANVRNQFFFEKNIEEIYILCFFENNCQVPTNVQVQVLAPSEVSSLDTAGGVMTVSHYTFCILLYILFMIIHFVSDTPGGGANSQFVSVLPLNLNLAYPALQVSIPYATTFFFKKKLNCFYIFF
jgi:hypothetical protein